MPSLDIVSDVDLQELDNAVNQTSREISQRFDFRGGKSSVELEKQKKIISIVADDDFKLRSIHQILMAKMAKQGIDVRCLKFPDPIVGSMGLLKQTLEVKTGLNKEEAKKVVKLVKDLKTKVNPEIQEEQVRLSSKSIDELREVMDQLQRAELGFPVQFTNMKR
jgi:uncharacterized protein YajQ (UPF0234 family)